MLKSAAIFLVVLGAGSALMATPSVQLSIHDGRVWLKTDHATMGDILSEWARVGDTQIVSVNPLPTAPLSVQMDDVSELEALEVITRAAGGFITVARPAGIGARGANASTFSRVVVVAGDGGPTRREPAANPATAPYSSSPRASAPSPVYAPTGAQRVLGSDGLPVPDDQEDAPPPPRAPDALPPGTSIPPGFSEPSGSRPSKGTAVPGVITPPAPPTPAPRPPR